MNYTDSLLYSNEDAIADSLLYSNEEDISLYSINIPYQLHEDRKLQKHFERKRLLLFVDSVLSHVEEDLLSQQKQSSLSSPSSSSSSNSSTLTQRKCDSFSLLLKQLPISIDLKQHDDLNMNLSLADASIKQLIKDLDRDKIIINGINIYGSEVGLDGCIPTLSYIIDVLTNEMKFETLSDKLKEDISIKALKLASRTSSGGLSYQVLLNNIDIEKCVIIPMSNLALPLIIKLSIGAFRDDNGNKRIGLICDVHTAYYFKIKSLEGDNDEGSVKVSYMNTINIHLYNNGFKEGISQSNNSNAIRVAGGCVKIENYI